MPAGAKRLRCPWVDLNKPDYVAYHDEEWGVPVHDERRMFEMLTLEGAQAGLSWYTVLRKRANYRAAFSGFDIGRVAAFSARDVDRLVGDAGLIRHRQKLESTVSNARAVIALQASDGGLCNYLWSWVDGVPVVNAPRSLQDYPATTALSDRISKDLKKRGFKFVGSTIVYALLQAVGIVNDHAADCYRLKELRETQKKG